MRYWIIQPQMIAGTLALLMVGAMLSMVLIPHAVVTPGGSLIDRVGGNSGVNAGAMLASEIVSVSLQRNIDSYINGVPAYVLPAMGVIGLCIVALACALAGVFIIIRKG